MTPSPTVSLAPYPVAFAWVTTLQLRDVAVPFVYAEVIFSPAFEASPLKSLCVPLELALVYFTKRVFVSSPDASAPVAASITYALIPEVAPVRSRPTKAAALTDEPASLLSRIRINPTC